MEHVITHMVLYYNSVGIWINWLDPCAGFLSLSKHTKTCHQDGVLLFNCGVIARNTTYSQPGLFGPSLYISNRWENKTVRYF